MGPVNSKSKLSQSIAEILGTADPAPTESSPRPGPLRRSLIYTSMALLAINPLAVNAVGLGELAVNSALGEPLNATVPVTLAAGESMPENCISATRGDSGLSGPKNLVVKNPAWSNPGTYNLRVTTANALHEPMYEIALLIDCPGTSLLLRQYVLMLDLPVMTISRPDTPAAVATSGDVLSVAPQRSVAAGNNNAPVAVNNPRRLVSSGNSIPAGQAYRVSQGDTLSTIAARIETRAPDTTWSVAKLIFSMNPQAFIRNNPDLIKLGSKIDIPSVEQLARLDKGTGPIIVSAIPKQARVATRTRNSELPRPAPQQAPVVTAVSASRPEVTVTEPQASQPAVTSTPKIAVPEENFVPTEPAATVTEEPQAGPTSEIVYTSPFLDEVTSAESAAANSTNTVSQPAPVIVTPVPEPTSVAAAAADNDSGSNPFLAILIGILMGVLLSLALLRRQLIDAVADLLRRGTSAKLPVAVKKSARPPIMDSHDADDDSGVPNTAFDPREAESVFSKYPDSNDELQIGKPKDDSYVVESGDSYPTEEFQAADEDSSAMDPTAIAKIDIGTSVEDNSDEQILAQLFDENAENANLTNNDIFDPSGGDVGNAETLDIGDATLAFPEWEDEMDFDNENSLASQTLKEFQTGQFQRDHSEFLLDETANMEIDGTAQMMSPQAMDENELSESLQAAMALLEKDYDEEFTSSQLLKSADVDDALDDDPTLNMEDDVEA